MDSTIISGRILAIVDEQLDAFDALISAVEHVALSSPSASQRVILCNNLVVGLTARIEEALRQIFIEYLRILEDCEATFFDLKVELQNSSFKSAVLSLKKYSDWEEAKRKTNELNELLSGVPVFKFSVVSIVYNQGNMRSAEVTDIAKRFGLNGIWQKVAKDEWFSAEMGEEDFARLEGLIIQKWNGVFDERDNVVHRVAQASGWGTELIKERIEFSKHVVSQIGRVVIQDCGTWYDSLSKNKNFNKKNS